MLRWLSGKIKSGLAKTKGAFTGVFDLLRGKGKVDQDFLDELEKRALPRRRRHRRPRRRSSIAFARRSSTRRSPATSRRSSSSSSGTARRPTTPGINYAASGPTVVMVAGVNGSGKTTSIAKLAQRLKERRQEGAGGGVRHVPRRGGRAAHRSGPGGSAARSSSRSRAATRRRWPTTPARRRKARGFDVLIVDTAGRLHTQTHLMRELEKIHRVVTQADRRGPARGAAGARRHHRPERDRAGREVHEDGEVHRHHPDQARRHRQGRGDLRDQAEARPAGEVRRRRRDSSTTWSRSTRTPSWRSCSRRVDLPHVWATSKSASFHMTRRIVVARPVVLSQSTIAPARRTSPLATSNECGRRSRRSSTGRRGGPGCCRKGRSCRRRTETRCRPAGSARRRWGRACACRARR